MQGLKSAILAIFQKSSEMALPCYCSPQKALSKIENLLLFWVPMNLKNTLMAELEVASFLSIRSVYRQCELDCFLNFLFISGLFDMSFVVKNKTLCFRINSLVKFDENHTALVHVGITDVEDLVTVQISS